MKPINLKLNSNQEKVYNTFKSWVSEKYKGKERGFLTYEFVNALEHYMSCEVLKFSHDIISAKEKLKFIANRIRLNLGIDFDLVNTSGLDKKQFSIVVRRELLGMSKSEVDKIARDILLFFNLDVDYKKDKIFSKERLFELGGNN